MRFDDRLQTVLSSEDTSASGAQVAWRQILDLLNRGQFPADEPIIARLRLLRQAVPVAVRAVTAQAAADGQPPAALVGLFAEDQIDIAAPVLRTATISSMDWIALLPRLCPTGRSVLRHRRDLPVEVVNALGAFGATDFVIPHVQTSPAPIADLPGQVETPPPVRAVPNGFVISDLVARIEAFNRARDQTSHLKEVATEDAMFRYETDAEGVIRWVEGVARTALVGVSLGHGALQGVVQIDGVAAGALRRRSRFADARLEVGGLSDASGSWRMSGVPVFDAATGRFTGLRGTARRPRADEAATPFRPAQSPVADSLRQLVHELRTPTNAIAGFAELIESELVGVVPDPYRTQAKTIRALASALIAAIDDLDVAARIDGHALELRAGHVPVAPLLERIVDDLQPLASLRGATLTLEGAADGPVEGDDRAVERLVGRLLAALVSAAALGEQIGVRFGEHVPGAVEIAIDRPRALGSATGDTLLSLDADADDENREGAPLLGTGFALRLARNLAGELGGSLTIGADRLTLCLPAVSDRSPEQLLRP